MEDPRVVIALQGTRRVVGQRHRERPRTPQRSHIKSPITKSERGRPCDVGVERRGTIVDCHYLMDLEMSTYLMLQNPSHCHLSEEEAAGAV